MKKILFKIQLILIITLLITPFVSARSRKDLGKNLKDSNKINTSSSNVYLTQNVQPKLENNTPIQATSEKPSINSIPDTKNKVSKIETNPNIQATKETIIPTELAEEFEEITDKPIVSSKKTNPIKNTDDEIYLNFENAELINFINYIASLKNINIIPDKSLEGNKITLSMRKAVTKEKAWQILLTVADSAGYTIVKVGDVYKILPNSKKLIEPLPSYIGVDAKDLPDSDTTIRYVCFLNNIQAGEIRGWVENMLGSPGMVLIHEKTNSLIITDKAFNIKATTKIIQELDQTGLKESVLIIKLSQANATEVRDLLNSLIEGQKDDQASRLSFLLGRRPESSTSSYFSAGTKVIAEERTNSLIVLGSKESTEKIEQFVKTHIDIKLKEIESPLHIYELQYIEAKQAVDLLKEALTLPESEAGQQAGKYGAIRGGVKYFRNIVLKADESGNRIIASAIDKKDWKLLKETISDLDKPQPQVAIETLIVIVDATNKKYLGGQMRNKKHGQLGKWNDAQTTPISQTVLDNDNKTLLGNLISSLTGGLGSTLLTFGKANNIWGIFKALQLQTHVSVVAQPFLNVCNKYEALITIGETKRQTSEIAITGGGIAGQQDVEANLSVKVKPQINIDGIVNLQLDITYNEFIADSTDNLTKRNLITNVSIADGQVLALGGFIKTKVTENTQKTPVLGNIPGLGWFFKTKSKEINKQNILIFMCPTIIKPRSEPGVNLYTRIKLHNAKQVVDTSDPISKDPVYNWFFDKKSYAYKIEDFATARYQPVTVDLKNDEYYTAKPDDKNGTEKNNTPNIKPSGETTMEKKES